jgi:hypothetical protein
MLKQFVSSLALVLPSIACGPTYTVTPSQLKPGGVFVTAAGKCDKGCDQIARGDLIQGMDGNPVAESKDLDALTDGSPHKLKVHKKDGTDVEIEVVAQKSDDPIAGAPPFFSASAEGLNEAPSWARLRLFAHASPQILLVNSDGGLINGRDLYGKPRLIVLFDWQTRTGQANAATFLKTLQLAQDDLKAAGVEIMFTQLKFPGRDRPPMNDTDLRDFHKTHQLSKKEGGPKPFLPLYRPPNATEDMPARRLGLEGSTTYEEYLGSDPAIIVMDERGVIHWHSEGVTPDPSGENPSDANYTIIKAINFAKEL